MEYKIIYYLTHGLNHFWPLRVSSSLFCTFFFCFCNYMLHINPHLIVKKLLLVQSTASLFSFEKINLINRLTENILDHYKHKEHHNKFKAIKVAEIFFSPLLLGFSKQTKKQPKQRETGVSSKIK